MSNRHAFDPSREDQGQVQPQSNSQIPFAGMFVLMCLAAAVWTILSITRHDLFNSTGFDLAINEQIVWNTLNGRFFASSVEVDNSFADHFRPMLLAIVPFYAIFQTPKTLLVVQALVLASAAIPVFLLAQHKLKNDWLAFAFAAVYLFYPAIGFVARFDFHIEVFAIPAFIAAFYMLETGRWGAASWFMIIPLLCKENMGLLVAAIGVYAVLRWRNYKWGMSWVIAGLVFTWFTMFWLIPTIRGEAADAISRYAWLGDSPADIVRALIFEPSLWISHMFTREKLIYALQLLLPLGFLPLIGWRELAIAIPGFGINLLAQHFCQSTIYCHYAVPVIPFIFIAAIMGFSILQSWVKAQNLSHFSAAGLVVLGLISLWMWQPFQEVPILPSAFEPIGNAAVVEQALAAVPADGSLSLVTTNDYAPHLARRQGLFIVGIPTQRETPIDPDLLFLNLYDQQYIVCDQIRAYVSQLNSPDYGVIFRTGGLIVIQKNGGSPDQFIDFAENWNNCAG